MTPLSENSAIRLGFAVLVIGGGAAWMTRQEMQTSANAAQIEHVKDFAKVTQDSLIIIDRRLFAIEQILQRIEKRRKD